MTMLPCCVLFCQTYFKQGTGAHVMQLPDGLTTQRWSLVKNKLPLQSKLSVLRRHAFGKYAAFKLAGML